MANKRKVFSIKEQVVEDLATGLTIEFKAREDGEFRLCLCGEILPLGNREIHFDKDGDYVGAGTQLTKPK